MVLEEEVVVVEVMLVVTVVVDILKSYIKHREVEYGEDSFCKG
jgi:hypothetical protein